MAAEAEATGEPRQPGGSRKHACEVCGKSFMSAKRLEHHLANADRLCTAA
jgi:hypothetical protein